MTLKPCHQGEPVTMPAQDSIGFVRKPAPLDGFAWEDGDTCGFISQKDVETALVDLKTKKRWRPR